MHIHVHIYICIGLYWIVLVRGIKTYIYSTSSLCCVRRKRAPRSIWEVTMTQPPFFHEELKPCLTGEIHRKPA